MCAGKSCGFNNEPTTSVFWHDIRSVKIRRWHSIILIDGRSLWMADSFLNYHNVAGSYCAQGNVHE